LLGGKIARGKEKEKHFAENWYSENWWIKLVSVKAGDGVQYALL
jgi:hypothetical protein